MLSPRRAQIADQRDSEYPGTAELGPRLRVTSCALGCAVCWPTPALPIVGLPVGAWPTPRVVPAAAHGSRGHRPHR